MLTIFTETGQLCIGCSYIHNKQDKTICMCSCHGAVDLFPVITFV